MRRILYYVIGICVIAYGWHRYQHTQFATMDEYASDAPAVEYRCDGRVYCSQMHSCQEAQWFLQHCSGMKMDGDNNGVPCEKQWCGHH